MARVLNGTEKLIAARLVVADALFRAGNIKEAERIYGDALMLAEEDSGENSALAGVVLLELFAFYDRQKRDDEAKAAWERVRQIIINYFEDAKSA